LNTWSSPAARTDVAVKAKANVAKAAKAVLDFEIMVFTPPRLWLLAKKKPQMKPILQGPKQIFVLTANLPPQALAKGCCFRYKPRHECNPD
jgi:hypothetical protein